MSYQDSLREFLVELWLASGPSAVTEALSGLGAFVITQDGTIVAANSAFCAILEQDPHDITGLAASELIAVDEHTAMQSRFLQNETTPYTLKLKLKNTRTKYVRVTPQLLTVKGKTARLAEFSDVSDYVALKNISERFKKVFSVAGIGIARVSPKGEWLECNEKLCEILGYSQNELLKMRFQDITHPDDIDKDLQYVQEMLAGTRSAYTMEKRYLRKLGGHIWTRLTVTLVRDIANNPQYFVSLVQEITAEKKAQAFTKKLNQTLQSLSLTDGLTGIGNRRKFDTALANEWRRACRDHTRIALIIADIDQFKLFNDQLGHLAGDDCLKEIAATLEKHANRVSDCVARYGGEEFVILLPGVSLSDAVGIAETCRKAVENLGIAREIHGEPAVTTISLGVAETAPDKQIDPNILIDAADQKLYEAKHAGRNRVMPPHQTSGDSQ